MIYTEVGRHTRVNKDVVGSGASVESLEKQIELSFRSQAPYILTLFCTYVFWAGGFFIGRLFIFFGFFQLEDEAPG